MRTILILLLLSAQLLNAQNLNDGIVAHYPFNGNANDESINNNHGVVNGATLTTDRFGNENNAYLFDGIDDFIEIPDHNSLDIENITISLWIKPNDFKPFNNGYSNYSEYSGPISKTTTDPYNQTGFSTTSNNLSLRFSATFEGGSSSQPGINGNIGIDEWIHVVYVFENGVIRIFKNSELLLENSDYSNKKLSSNNEPMFIGKTFWFPNYSLLTSYFSGCIDDIKIYNNALSSCEIAICFNEGKCYETVYDTITTYISKDQPQDGLAAYYPFNGNANDESGNANNGVVYGATLTTDRFGNDNSAYAFNGYSSKIVIDTSNLGVSDKLTLSCWVKTTSNTDEFIISKYDWTADKGYHLVATNDGYAGINGRDANGEYNISSGNIQVINDGNWHLLTGIIEKNIWEIYVDGVLEYSLDTEHSQVDLSNSMLLTIGYHDVINSSDDRYFKGSLDDIRIYNKALSPTEVKTLYYEGMSLEEIFRDINVVDTITHHDTIYTNISNDQPRDSLVAYYPFNGNANDESGNANNGEVYGATLATDRFGNDNSAYLFDGVNDLIILPNEFDYPNRTISLWFNAKNINTYNRLFVSDNPNIDYGSTRIWLNDYLGDKKLMYTIWEMEDNTIKVSVEENKWYFATISIEGNKINTYVNGELIDSRENEYKNSVDGLAKSILGASRTGSNRFFDGKIDDVRIYNKTLSPTEVKTLYYEGISLEEILSDVNIYDTTYITETIIEYDTTFVNDTLIHYDTVKTYITDTIFAYDSISVTDTLIIDVLFSDINPQDVSSIKIYPNPTKDRVQILIDDELLNQEYNIKIVTNTGILVFESDGLNLKNYEVDMKQFGKEGLYFIQILNQNNVIIDTRKIILE